MCSLDVALWHRVSRVVVGMHRDRLVLCPVPRTYTGPLCVLAVEHVRQLVAFVGELILDVKGVYERKHKEQGSDDADPRRSTQEECNSRASCYDGNPGPHRT